MSATPSRSIVPLADLAAVVRSVAAGADLWEPRLRIPGNGEDRWWTRLSADDWVEVWLLSWLPGHATERAHPARSPGSRRV